MQAYCITINNFYLIPVTRYILQLFAKRYETVVVECHIKGQYPVEGLRGHRFIGHFSGFKALSQQTIFFKVWKYLYIHLQLIRLLGKKSLVLYTPDWQVAAILFRYKELFGKKEWKIIYHQFELIEDHQLAGNNLKTWKTVLKKSYLADLLIFPEINRLEYYRMKGDVRNTSCIVFPNTCKTSEAAPTEENSLLKEKIPDNAMVVGHIGNVGPNHYLQQFVDIIEACTEENIYFVLAGRYAPAVMNIFNNIRNPKLIYLGELPHQELGKIYARLDTGFILYKGVDLNFEYCAPNKLYEYWSYGIPVIAHSLTGLKPVFDTNEKGHLLDFENNNIVQTAREKIKNHIPSKEKLIKQFRQTLDIDIQMNILNEKLKSIT